MLLLDLPSHLWFWARDLVPSSSYTTSAKGLTWQQILKSPLPPYLSPLPVIFRILAYLVISPALFLIALDVGGYLVFRIYDQPFWCGTRTAFYKFRTSPVFTRASASSSPNTARKHVPLPAAGSHESSTSTINSLSGTHRHDASGFSSPEGREASISPVSSSASLMGLHDTDDPNAYNASDYDTRPHTPENDKDPHNSSSRNSNNLAKTIPTMQQLNRHIQKRHLQKNASQAQAAAAVGPGPASSLATSRSARQDENVTPTAITTSYRPNNASDEGDVRRGMPGTSNQLTRSNSLGLGFQASPALSEDGSEIDEVRMYPIFSPAHEVTQLNSPPRSAQPGLPTSTSSSAAAPDASPKSTKSSGASSAQILEEDDRAFNEAKQAVSGNTGL